MASQQDQDDLLDALFAMNQATGKRPSILGAQLQYFPDWSRERLSDAAKALEANGDILNLSPRGMFNVDLFPGTLWEGRNPPLAEVPDRLPMCCPRRNWYARCRCKPASEWLPADTRLEKNPGGVPEEELPIPDVTREHGVRGVPCLLPDLER